MPGKTTLDQLKGSVKAQELRLAHGMKMLGKGKKNLPSSNSEWDALERVVGLMDDLLTSYRSYTKELEKKVKSHSGQTMVGKA